MEKREIRKVHMEIRNRMSAAEAAGKSEIICRKLVESSWYQRVELVFGYYPLGKEVDCLPFLKRALADGKRVALPRTGRECAMDFFEIVSLDQVEEGAFHVMEPKAECPRVKPEYRWEEETCLQLKPEGPQVEEEPLQVKPEGSQLKEWSLQIKPERLQVEEKCFQVKPEGPQVKPGTGGYQQVMLVPGVVFDRAGNRYGYGKGYYDRYLSRFPQLPTMALAYENQMETELETLPTDVKMNRIYTEDTVYQI